MSTGQRQQVASSSLAIELASSSSVASFRRDLLPHPVELVAGEPLAGPQQPPAVGRRRVADFTAPAHHLAGDPAAALFVTAWLASRTRWEWSTTMTPSGSARSTADR